MKIITIFLIVVALIAGMVVYINRLPPPYNPEIRDWHDLDRMRYHLDKSFILMNNLDATTAGYEKLASDTAHKGKGWVPIGTPDNRFTGSFDGQGHEIKDMFINRPDESTVGLFGVVDELGVIQNVGVVDIAVIGIPLVDSESLFVLGFHDRAVGGLVGENRGTVMNSYSIGSVTGAWSVGGLVGENLGAVESSYSSGEVAGYSDVGGLIGGNLGTVSNSYFTGSVTENLADRDPVTSKNTNNVLQAGCISSSLPCAIVLISPPVGATNVPVTHIGFAWTCVEGADSYNWVLSPNPDLTSSIDTKIGLVIAAYAYTGRLASDTEYYWQVTAIKGGVEIDSSGIGVFQTRAPTDVITRCFDVGGLVGYNRGTVSSSYFTGSVTSFDSVGGLVGENEGTVTDSYSIGSITGEWLVGGLVGENLGTVRNSYSSSSVTGHWAVGGLVGDNQGDVSDCYSSRNVTGHVAIGGLVGYMSLGTISNSYSTSGVTGYANIGGLAGLKTYEGVVRNSFWDTQISRQATSDGGTGKTTTEMKTIATFSGAGWSIATVVNPDIRNPSYVWNMVDRQTYPFLSWQSAT